MQITDRFYYNVDSDDRLGGSESKFNVRIPLPRLDFQYVVVKDLFIPKTYWLIPSGENTFILIEGGVSTTITIPAGNYLAKAFGIVVQGLLNTNSPNKWTYAMAYPNIGTTTNTGFWTFTVTGNSSQPSLQFVNYCYEQFGFEANTTHTFVSNTLISTSVIFMQVESNVSLRTNMIDELQGILETVHSGNTVDFGIIAYNCSDAYMWAHKLKIPNPTCPDFYVTDPHGSSLNLNGTPINFTLMYFNVNPIFDKIEAFMKLYILEKEMIQHENNQQNAQQNAQVIQTTTDPYKINETSNNPNNIKQ